MASIPRSYKIIFVASIVIALAITLIGGKVTADEAPPYPVNTVFNSSVLITKDTLLNGQAVWQRYGLMDTGSIWGHGTYRGNDYTATTLNLIGVFMRDFHANERFRKPYEKLSVDEKGVIDRVTIAEIKGNRFDAATGTLTLTKGQAFALEKVRAHWDSVFSSGDIRNVVPKGNIKAAVDRRDLADFFFWTAWAAGTKRPGKDLTYTSNWPPDRSVGNEIASAAVIWSIVGIAGFMFALAIAIMFYVRRPKDSEGLDPAAGARIAGMGISGSQRLTVLYFLVVVVLFIVQLAAGAVMAHYTSSPGDFFGLTIISDNVPYNLVKSWHLQLAIFWIAIAWIGSAIYVAPIAGKREPKGQTFLVGFLFVAAFIVVAGTLIGTAWGVKTGGGKLWFLLAHQGWEFLELGRLWQMLLFAGLVIWLVIVWRAVKPNFGKGQDRWGTVPFYTYSAVAIVAFFAFGLFYGPKTHITIADFWRWWVVHTWVEGVFEFFAAAAIAYMLVTLGLSSKQRALTAAYLTASLALFSGIIGVGHHYYWFGDPDIWLSLGGVVSAVEPVPIILLLLKSTTGASPASTKEYEYRWPLNFTTASSFWLFFGAGMYGFMITLPFVNYYEHSTYLTSNHGHTALFGTYGMLAIGLMLFALRGIAKKEAWGDALGKFFLRGSFVLMNGGLILMSLTTLLPIGLMQTKASYEHGLWFARSAAFYERPIVKALAEWRIVPDSILILGAIFLAVFVVRAVLLSKKPTIPSGGAIVVPEK